MDGRFPDPLPMHPNLVAALRNGSRAAARRYYLDSFVPVCPTYLMLKRDVCCWSTVSVFARLQRATTGPTRCSTRSCFSLAALLARSKQTSGVSRPLAGWNKVRSQDCSYNYSELSSYPTWLLILIPRFPQHDRTRRRQSKRIRL